MNINTLPGKAMYLIWLNHLLSTKGARVDRHNKKVINLSYEASKSFSFGWRKENGTPIITVCEDMCPWFFSIPVKFLALTADGKIHVVYGSEGIDLCLSIKSPLSRAKVISRAELSPIGAFVDFHSLAERKGGMYLSRPLARTELVTMDSLEFIMPSLNNKPQDYSEHLLSDFELEDASNIDNFLDPL